MLITIIICTYNREDILRITLPCYDALRIPDNVKLEVIIINNNSKDKTESFVNDFIKRNTSKVNYSYFFEPKQGVSHARNTGYIHASGEYIAYLDDECVLPEQWLEVAQGIIKKEHPAFLGGPYYGKFLPGTTSSWFKESFGDSYIVAYDLPNGPMKTGYLSEGNIFVRRDVFEKTGLFDTELGMSGERISYGEGPDLQRRFIKQYPHEVIWFNPNLFVWHFIRDEKISMVYRFKEALIRGASSAKTGEKSWSRLFLSPFLLLYFSFKALFSAFWKFIQSLFFNKHFFTLLHSDYIDRTWRDIGASLYRTKLFLCKIFRFR